jgi:hypothetical protein
MLTYDELLQYWGEYAYMGWSETDVIVHNDMYTEWIFNDYQITTA